MDSRGSVIPLFQSLANKSHLPITDINMTRFMISLSEGIDLVLHAFLDMVGGEIYVKKIPSMLVTDIAKAICPNAKHRIIGIRPGEKVHEQMIGSEDSKHTFDYKDHYKILPAIHGWSSDPRRIKDGKPVPSDFTYSSNNNSDWMTVDDLRQILNIR
jgi:FlaA1/EpsC-like NDP-sugar epimerase